MSVGPDPLARAALGLLGVPFRLHGRDPATGLDCVGLVVVALERAGLLAVPPSGYALRNLEVTQWLPLAERSGLVPARGAACAGEVLLIVLPACQHHLVITADTANIVHAHAGLRRVVRQPLDPAWRIAARWRVQPPCEG